MYLQKVTSRIVLKNYFFAGILKVSDENSRIRIQDPDPLVKGMDPRIRIRIHTKNFMDPEHCLQWKVFLSQSYNRQLLNNKVTK
jgi:hypothetical protein